jgi:hypothetical protein
LFVSNYPGGVKSSVADKTGEQSNDSVTGHQFSFGTNSISFGTKAHTSLVPSLSSVGSGNESTGQAVGQFSFGAKNANQFTFGIVGEIPAGTKEEIVKPVDAKTERQSEATSAASAPIQNQTTKSLSFGDNSEGQPATAFSFRSKPEVQEAAKLSVGSTSDSKMPASTFSFGAKTEPSNSDTSKPALTFSFGAKTEPSSRPENSLSFGAKPESKQVDTDTSNGASASQAPFAFSFGSKDNGKFTASLQPNNDSTSSFNFGASTSTSSFSFGASTGTKPTEDAAKQDDDMSQDSESPTAKTTSFSLNPQPNGNSTILSFGASSATTSTQKTVDSKPTTFTFGSNSSNTTGGFAFGGSQPTSSSGGFTFGQPTASKVEDQNAAVSSTSSFSFGNSSSANQTSSFQFGTPASQQAASSTPFGQPTNPSSTSVSTSSSGTSAVAPSFNFGGPPQPASNSFTFGSNNTTTAQPPATNPFGQTPQFGQANTTQAPFSHPAATPFGQTTPAPAFNSSAPASTSAFSFGATTNNTPSQFAFGQPPVAPATSNSTFAFGAAPPQQTSNASNPSSGFSFNFSAGASTATNTLPPPVPANAATMSFGVPSSQDTQSGGQNAMFSMGSGGNSTSTVSGRKLAQPRSRRGRR